ncbi:MAG: Gfo/Idh/MocA family oxidoreductase [Dongiaceae bacterium]
MAARKLRWGIISTARIGTEKVIPGLMRSERCHVQAIASRSLDLAQSTARRLGIPTAHGSYEALLADPEIDIVYNPLPNHLHVPLTLQAAAAGKHVLCEKPIGLDAKDAARLLQADGKVLIMEAFMVRFHPQWLRVRELVREGSIGPIRAIQSYFAYYNDDPANIRNMAHYGGGAALDIGCYPIVIGRYLYETEPRRIIALVDRDPNFKIDRTTSALVDFGAGRQLDFTVSTQSVPYQRVQVIGTKGRIDVQIPFNAPQTAATRIFIDDGSALDGAAIRTETFPPADQYALQGDAFTKMVLGETAPAYGVEDALRNMRVIDALFRSEQTASWAEILTED